MNDIYVSQHSPQTSNSLSFSLFTIIIVPIVLLSSLTIGSLTLFNQFVNNIEQQLAAEKNDTVQQSLFNTRHSILALIQSINNLAQANQTLLLSGNMDFKKQVVSSREKLQQEFITLNKKIHALSTELTLSNAGDDQPSAETIFRRLHIITKDVGRLKNLLMLFNNSNSNTIKLITESKLPQARNNYIYADQPGITSLLKLTSRNNQMLGVLMQDIFRLQQIIAQQSFLQIKQQVQNTSTYFYLMAFLMATICLYVSTRFMTKRLLSPLKNLSWFITVVSQGNPFIHIDTHQHNDEIGVISNAIKKFIAIYAEIIRRGDENLSIKQVIEDNFGDQTMTN